MPFIKVWLPELRINGETAQPTGSPSSLVSLQRGSHAVLERRQPSWDLFPPRGPTLQLKPCCLASAWSTAPAPFHLHHGLCSSMPISQTVSDLPLKEQPIPEEAWDARGWGCPRSPRLPAPGGGGRLCLPQGAPAVPTPWSSQPLTLKCRHLAFYITFFTILRGSCSGSSKKGIGPLRWMCNDFLWTEERKLIFNWII